MITTQKRPLDLTKTERLRKRVAGKEKAKDFVETNKSMVVFGCGGELIFLS